MKKLLSLSIIFLLLIGRCFKNEPNLRSFSLVQKPKEFKPIFDTTIKHGSREKYEVALTFDADMTPFMKEELENGEVKTYYDKRIIEILEKQKVPATLFLTGLWALKYSKETKKLAQNPLFEIGNHSYSHPAFARPCFKLPPITETQKEEEFQLSSNIFKEITGYELKLFRFPGGCYQKKDLNLAKKYGLTVIAWDVDSRDAFNSSAQEIIETVKKEVKPGSILIFHLHNSEKAFKTAEALPSIISYLKEKSYSFTTVGGMLKELQD